MERDEHSADVRRWGFAHPYLGKWLRRGAAQFAKEDAERAEPGLACFSGSGELTTPITPTAQKRAMGQIHTIESITNALLAAPVAMFAAAPAAAAPESPEQLRSYLSQTATGRAVLAARDKKAYEAGQTPAGSGLSAEDRAKYLSMSPTGRAILRGEQKTRWGLAKS